MKRLFTFLSISLLCLGLSAAVSEKTADYGLLLSDNGNTIVMNSSSNLIVYLPALGTDNIGYTVTIMKKGTGQVKIQAPLADYVGDSSVNGYLQNTTALTNASVTLHLGKLHYWYVTAATGTWATDNTSSPYGVESPTYGTVYATTFDTNVAAAGVTLSGITLAADGTDSNIDITLTPKGTGEVNLPKVDIDAGVAQLTTLGVTNLANHIYYVDGGRTDTYTADGSMLLPYKSIVAALTVINADTLVHAAAGDYAGTNYVIKVAPGTYSDALTFTNYKYLRVEGHGVFITGAIALTQTQQSGDYYSRLEFVGSDGWRSEKGPALKITGAITATRNNDSLTYVYFNGCWITGNTLADGDGTWVLQYENCKVAGTIDTGTFADADSAILLECVGRNSFAGAITDKVSLYNVDNSDFAAAITITPVFDCRVTNCRFSSTVSIVAVKNLDVDTVSLKAIIDRTPTLTGMTVRQLDYIGTETYAGVNELSTDAEAVTGTATDKVLTPANLVAHLAAPAAIGGTTPAAITGTTIAGTTFDTNVAAAGVTLAGTTLAADGTDSNIGIAITPKGTGVVALGNTTATSVSTGGAGVAAATGNVATENALGTVHSTVLTLTDVDIAPAAAAAGVAFGSVKLYDFPEGYVYYIGAVADLSLTDTISAGAEMAGNFATWTPAGNWAYASDKWSHTTGDATALTTDVVPVAGTTYKVSVTMATSTAGGGVVVAMGGVSQSEVHGTGTETWTFTASNTDALTLTPASGTWVGDITAVSVTTFTPVSATWNGDISIGTAADADGSLAGTEVDLIPKTTTPAAVAGVATADCQSTATEIAIHDGHSTAKDLYLNLLIDAADFVDAGTGALHLNGTVTITWIKLGDN